jgi:hypothetical protein
MSWKEVERKKRRTVDGSLHHRSVVVRVGFGCKRGEERSLVNDRLLERSE